MKGSSVRSLNSSRHGISRRSFVGGGVAAGAAATIGNRLSALAAHVPAPYEGKVTYVQATPSVDISGTKLSILQWQHFVPSYDDWFPTFLQEWGEANGVETSLDQINTADIPAAFSGEISAQSGHDLIEHISPLPQFEKSVVDMKDLWDEAEKRYGKAVENCRNNSFNPTTGKYYAFAHGYAPDPGNYRKSLWDKDGMANGPTSFDELKSGATSIFENQGVQAGIGMSQEIDSQMAAQVIIWAHGGSMQDENENVILNSPETIAAVNYMKDIFKSAMTPEVFSWNAASNNQLLAAGRASYIINSLSAYRSAQTNAPDVAKDIFFLPPLVGPAGDKRALAHAHAAMAYYLPSYSQNQDTAREFLLHLIENYQAALEASQLYNFPAFPDSAPKLADQVAKDPFGSDPADKLSVIANAADWTVNTGWPGPCNAMAGEALSTFVLSDMMAKASREEMSVEDAVAEADGKLNQIAENWRNQGLMGGGQ